MVTCNMITQVTVFFRNRQTSKVETKIERKSIFVPSILATSVKILEPFLEIDTKDLTFSRI